MVDNAKKRFAAVHIVKTPFGKDGSGIKGIERRHYIHTAYKVCLYVQIEGEIARSGVTLVHSKTVKTDEHV